MCVVISLKNKSHGEDIHILTDVCINEVERAMGQTPCSEDNFEDNFLKLILSFHFYMGSVDRIPIVGQVSLLGKPPYQANTFIF